MNNSHRFLDLYRSLEEALKNYYNGKQTRYSSLVIEYMNGDGRKHYDELDFCRELRNLLSHHSDIAGTSPVEPSEALISTLEGIIREVENPVTAKDMIIPAKKLVFAVKNDKVAHLINKMTEKGYSHIPVFRNEKLFGVLSIDAVFRFMKNNTSADFSALTVADMDEYLPADRHIWEKYAFTGKNAPASEVRELFRASGPDTARVAAVFVTEDGTENSRVIGMITPWDVIKSER